MSFNNKSSNNNNNVIKKYKVPSIQLPISFKDKKRERGDMGWDITNKKRKENHNNNENNKSLKDENILIMEERHKIMKSIKELASTTLTGIHKKEYKYTFGTSMLGMNNLCSFFLSLKLATSTESLTISSFLFCFFFVSLLFDSILLFLLPTEEVLDVVALVM
jgi:hypothetical protein